MLDFNFSNCYYKNINCAFALNKGEIYMSSLLEVSLPGWVETLTNSLTNVINPILILAATAGVIYAVVVGVKFVKAEDKSARDEAKQKLITVIVGIVVTFVLIAGFYWLQYLIKSGQLNFQAWW